MSDLAALNALISQYIRTDGRFNFRAKAGSNDGVYISGTLPGWLVKANYSTPVQRDMDGYVCEVEITAENKSRFVAHIEAYLKRHMTEIENELEKYESRCPSGRRSQ